jgi:hypothetical protein
MSNLETAEAHASDGNVTIWLPLLWPVMTLTVLRCDTHDVVWRLAHESFRAVAMPAEGMEIRIERIIVEHLQQDDSETVAAALSRSPLRYGEAPRGMRQFIPHYGEPPELEPGVPYIIAVRERQGAELRRFTLWVA